MFDDDGEAGSGEQDVAGLDVGMVGDVEEGRDGRPEEEDPAGKRKARGGPRGGGRGAGGTMKGGGDGPVEGAADGGGTQKEIEDACDKTAEDERESG